MAGALQQQMGKMVLQQGVGNLQQQVQARAGAALSEMTNLGAQMGIRDPLDDYFQGPGLTVQQTMKGCVRECFGCEDTSEYRIGGWRGRNNSGPLAEYTMYALEESDGWIRCCLCNCFGLTSARKLTLTVSQFNPNDKPDPEGPPRGRDGKPLIKFHKPWSCPVCVRIPTNGGIIPIPCCFWLPEMTGTRVVAGAAEVKIGKSKYFCDQYLCVPKWKVYDASDKEVFLVRPDTCCMNCCIKCKCDGHKGGCLYEQMVLRDLQGTAYAPPPGGADDQQSAVTKLWGGMKKECCSEADDFVISYPASGGGGTSMPDTNMKANLLGLTFLIDFTFYEGNEM